MIIVDEVNVSECRNCHANARIQLIVNAASGDPASLRLCLRCANMISVMLQDTLDPNEDDVIEHETE